MRPPIRLALAAAAIVAFADQLSKHWVLGVFDGTPGQIVVTGFFNLVLVSNRGVSFGLGNNHGHFNALLFTLLAAIIVAGLLAWLRRTAGMRLPLAIGLVIGGAVGNVIDRLTRGAVIDFLDFHVGQWHWFAFNLADAAICIGVTLMVIDSLLGRRGAPN